MSLQRGADIKGWEGVTRNLATTSEERQAWTVWTVWLAILIFITGLFALLLSQSEIPTVAKAIMTGLALLFTMALMSGVYAYLLGSAKEQDAKDRAAAARKAARATSARAATPAPAPVVEKAAAPAPEPEPAAAAEPEPAPEPVATEAPADADANRPEALAAARDGGDGDDLTLIKGVGPALKKLCNDLGFWHFDQIAAWTDAEVAWVDENLEGFKGRVTRDEWVAQAKILAAGGETEFSARQS